jgi:hypothetical protein
MFNYLHPVVHCIEVTVGTLCSVSGEASNIEDTITMAFDLLDGR